MPAHTRLKEREAGQGSLNEQGQVDFKGELLAKEMLLGKRQREFKVQALQNQDSDDGEIGMEEPVKR